MPPSPRRFDSAHEIPKSQITTFSPSPNRTNTQPTTPTIRSPPPPLPSPPDPTTVSDKVLIIGLKAAIVHINQILDPACEFLLARAMNPNNLIIIPHSPDGGGVSKVFKRDRHWVWSDIPDKMIEKSTKAPLENLLRTAKKEVAWLQRHAERLRGLLESRKAGRKVWVAFWVENRE